MAPLFVAARQQSFKAGHAGDGCYLPDKGLLKVMMVTSSRGEERTIAMLGPGAVVGELSMIDRRPALSFGCRVQRLLGPIYHREAFTKYMASHPAAFQALVSVLVVTTG